MNRTLVNEDEPVHMERRRALMDAFTPQNLEEHQHFVRELVRKKVDGFIYKGRADLVQEMLWKYHLMVALHFWAYLKMTCRNYVNLQLLIPLIPGEDQH